MKKIIALTLAFSTLFTSSAFADTINAQKNKVTIIANGEQVTADNFIVNGTTYVPLKAVSEELGMGVEYDSTTKTVTVDNDLAYLWAMRYTEKGALAVQTTYVFYALDSLYSIKNLSEDINFMENNFSLSTENDVVTTINNINKFQEELNLHHSDIIYNKDKLVELCNNNTDYAPLLEIYDQLDETATNIDTAIQMLKTYVQYQNLDDFDTYFFQYIQNSSDIDKLKTSINNQFTTIMDEYFEVNS